MTSKAIDRLLSFLKQDSPRWRALILIFVLSLPAVTTRLYASDEIQYFAYLRSLWFDQDLSFENEYRHFYDRGVAKTFGFQETFLEMTTSTGLRYNFGTIGSAILWAPFYAAGDFTARIMQASGSDVAVDGYSAPYISAVTLGSAVYGFLALVLSIVAAHRIVGSGIVPALFVWFGTPLFFYMYIAPGMAHACSAFAVAAFVVTWLRVREKWSIRGMALLGCFAALMAMVREQDVFFVIGPIVDFIWSSWKDVRGPNPSARSFLPRIQAAIVGVFVACFLYLPQVISYIVLNGHIGPPNVIQTKMDWTAPHAGLVLLSSEHGLLVWTPLVLLSLCGLILLAIRNSEEGSGLSRMSHVTLGLLLMAVAQVYVTGSLSSWASAGAFGQRRFVGATVILVIGLAAFLKFVTSGWKRQTFGCLIGLCIWWNIGLMVQFGSGMMDRQKIELQKNAYNSFVRVPRELPSLAYRYFFDRHSFYEPHNE